MFEFTEKVGFPFAVAREQGNAEEYIGVNFNEVTVFYGDEEKTTFHLKNGHIVEVPMGSGLIAALFESFIKKQ